MQYIDLVVLTTLILTIERGNTTGLRSILGFGDITSNENHTPVPTKISPVEKVLESFLVPIDMIENTTKIIDKGVSSIISNLPESLKKPIKENINSNKRGFGDVLNILSDRFQAIYPGTLWCGAGDIAKSEEDLGLFKQTDACCRDHDNCFNYISANNEKDDLMNNGIFTRSHCSCDHAFYQCLKDVGSIVAIKLGITYFDILSPQCFAEDYPIINCTKYASRSVVNHKCTDYNKDYSGEKKIQWFDNPYF